MQGGSRASQSRCGGPAFGSATLLLRAQSSRLLRRAPRGSGPSSAHCTLIHSAWDSHHLCSGAPDSSHGLDRQYHPSMPLGPQQEMSRAVTPASVTLLEPRISCWHTAPHSWLSDLPTDDKWSAVLIKTPSTLFSLATELNLGRGHSKA